jgi:hypothetical protein
MKLHFGAIPESVDFQPEEQGWNSLREPSAAMFQLYAVPFAFLNLAVLAALWHLVPEFKPGGGKAAVIGLLLTLLFFIPVHELLHALVAPGNGRSEKTLIGVWPQKLVFYAHYDGAMPRNRFLLVFATPFIVLSLLPVGVAFIWLQAGGDGAVPFVLQILSFLNGLAACGDALGFLMIWHQVPARAMVRNQGWKTYWKLPPASEIIEV